MDSTGPRPPDFMRGYPNLNPQQYMNVGFVSSPYPGKVGHGDYGPRQGGEIYYVPRNPTYPYPMDFNCPPLFYPPYQTYYDQDIPQYLRRRCEDYPLLDEDRLFHDRPLRWCGNCPLRGSHQHYP